MKAGVESWRCAILHSTQSGMVHRPLARKLRHQAVADTPSRTARHCSAFVENASSIPGIAALTLPLPATSKNVSAVKKIARDAQKVPEIRAKSDGVKRLFLLHCQLLSCWLGRQDSNLGLPRRTMYLKCRKN
jgi:hypothetical protein